MAIVEDEVRNESEEENEIEVVVEEDDADQESDSDDDDDEEVLERKVEELERQITEDPYNYDEHIELIQALWSLSELDRWRSAFDRLQQLSLLRAEHWLLRIQTEVTLAHSSESRDHITELFQQAALDCYSIPILSEWCTWSLGAGEAAAARAQLEEVLKRAGADPLSGKLFWDAKLELEKAQLDAMNEDDPEYKAQKERVLWCLEETVSRPLLRNDEAWPSLQEIAAEIHGQSYVDKAFIISNRINPYVSISKKKMKPTPSYVKVQHEAAVEYLQKITPYEDKLLTIEGSEEKCKAYEEYIEAVIELGQNEKYSECDTNGILKVLYDRATTECLSCDRAFQLLVSYARHAQRYSSRATYWRVLDACTRRCPRRAHFWIDKMRQAEHEDKHFDEVKSVFETALSKGMETYKQAEALWLSYLEYIRRHTAFDNEPDVERLRRTFRLAWDSLAEAWGADANDCDVPLYWARLEYKRMKDPKQGKEIFEEIFKYGDNKTLSKYWEAFIHLESARDPPISEHKLRDLYRRALRFVTDYPPAVAQLWLDYERDYGHLNTLRECADMCQTKIKEWRDSFHAMKEKMTGQKQKGNKQAQNKKTKVDNKKKKKEHTEVNTGNKGKRKANGDGSSTAGKRKRDEDMEVVVKEEDRDTGGGTKRSHDEDDSGEVSDSKRKRTESGDSSEAQSGSRDACTLFVSNLDFKVNEKNLRNKLSEYGEIVSMKVKAGVKAFGGSICYCQYTTPESVEKALKHDRLPLDGRPMFLSQYTSKKGKQNFKYATEPEKNKLFVRNLPFSHCTKDALTNIFNVNGKLKDIRIVTFKDGKPKGLAYIEYEDDNSAAQALEKTNGLLVNERKIEVAFSAPPPRADGNVKTAPTLGQPKRDTAGGMRRTQLSSFIPRVLQTPSTSKSQTVANGDNKRPLSNNDFRSMLLNNK